MRRGPLTCMRPQPQAVARLVCFAHAGGGPGAFGRWPAALAPDIEVWTATLPGRATRSDEPFAELWPALVQDFAGWLEPARDDEPPALLGHSLGGHVAFEVARELERRTGSGPRHLFVAGCRPPHRVPSHWTLPADSAVLVHEVNVRYGAVPPQVRAEPELLKRFVPMLRADLELAAAYTWDPGKPLRCPITALAGVEDLTAPPPEAQHWRAHTTGPFATAVLPGAHFFLHHELAAAAKVIRAGLLQFSEPATLAAPIAC
jgi:medium-chain acyl-[acyl-carrier-protein] hydrolase